MALVNAADLEQRFAISVLGRFGAEFPPATELSDRGLGFVGADAELPTSAHEPAHGVILQRAPNPPAQLHVRAVKVTPQQLAILQRRRKRRTILLRLLDAMRPHRAERLVDVRKTTLLEQMEPHFQI